MISASGVIQGWAPIARARRQRSASSPYMTKVRSKPPSASQRLRRIRKKQPITASTARALSRFQPPYISGLKTGLSFRTRARPVARQTRLHSVWSAKTQPGSSRPSPVRVRPPQMPAAGVRPAKATRRSIALSLTRVSGLSSSSSSPRASRAAMLLPLAKPWFSRLAISRSSGCAAAGKAAAIASAEPSGEALSRTMSS